MQSAGNKYYGGFFWLAAISFAVPLFVAVAAFEHIRPTTKPEIQVDASGVDHGLWDYLLRTYVESGSVDYDGLERDYLFKEYLRQVAGCDPDALKTREEKLALHCNAYNALVIHGVIHHKIHRNEKNVLAFLPKPAQLKIAELEEQLAQSTQDGQKKALQRTISQLRQESQFFGIEEYVFANETMSLDHLEHEIIRPSFSEPRIHVALVCAAKSCPAIRPEAYVGKRIEAQLQDQAVQFANNPKYLRLDATKQKLVLSPILKWYAEDWDADGGYLKWLQGLVKDEQTRNRLEAAQLGKLAVEFAHYDWALNATSAVGANSTASGGGFGSGSVPNE